MVMTRNWSLKSYSINPDTNIVSLAEWQIEFSHSDFPGVTRVHPGITPVPGELPADASPETILAAVQDLMASQMGYIEDHIMRDLEWQFQMKTATQKVDLRTPEEQRATMKPLSPRQAILGLLEIGITEEMVEGVIGDDASALTEWRRATQFERLHPLVVSLGTHFELPPEQIDALWRWAAEL